MIRILLIFLGSLSLSVGVIGIFVPGLPTTVFLLGAAACYVRSSERLYYWMLNHRFFGIYIKNYRKHKAMPLKSKIIALSMMWVMTGISTIFLLKSNPVKIIVLIAGLVGTLVILKVKTLPKQIEEDKIIHE